MFLGIIQKLLMLPIMLIAEPLNLLLYHISEKLTSNQKRKNYYHSNKEISKHVIKDYFSRITY
tara:strand:- start:2748 stop:2936 length:189 start_codon:yes stop_codon:yes gene_type:complete